MFLTLPRHSLLTNVAKLRKFNFPSNQWGILVMPLGKGPWILSPLYASFIPLKSHSTSVQLRPSGSAVDTSSFHLARSQFRHVRPQVVRSELARQHWCLSSVGSADGASRVADQSHWVDLHRHDHLYQLRWSRMCRARGFRPFPLLLVLHFLLRFPTSYFYTLSTTQAPCSALSLEKTWRTCRINLVLQVENQTDCKAKRCDQQGAQHMPSKHQRQKRNSRRHANFHSHHVG